MLPKWHAFWGVVFCIILKLISPQTDYVYLFLVWFASVFIDFDHYISAGIKTKRWGIKHALDHNYNSRQEILDARQKDLCIKGEFHLFHTVECHFVIGLIGIFFSPFFFLFIGMVLHSILDLIWMVWHDILYSREFFLINKLRAFLL